MNKEALYESLSANTPRLPTLIKTKDGFEFVLSNAKDWLDSWDKFQECHEPPCGRHADAKEAVADLYLRWPWLAHMPHPHFDIDDSCLGK